MDIKKTIMIGAFFVLALTPFSSFAAETKVLEGDEAKALYDQTASESYVLRQIDKIFILVAPDGTETEKPDAFTVKAGEYFFITNEEEKVVHNVYDQSDHSWVLKKQEPAGYAAIAFGNPGEHKLRCAIHPKMKVTVTVE